MADTSPRDCPGPNSGGGLDPDAGELVLDGPAVTDIRCPRCEGTGKYQRLPGTPVYPCAVCGGKGTLCDADFADPVGVRKMLDTPATTVTDADRQAVREWSGKHGTIDGDAVVKIEMSLSHWRERLAELVAAGRAAERERAVRLCVFRSCSWSKAEDARSQDYRDGIEDAASQLAAAIRKGPTP